MQHIFIYSLKLFIAIIVYYYPSEVDDEADKQKVFDHTAHGFECFCLRARYFFLEYSTISQLTPEDRQLLQDALVKALNKTKDGVIVNWKNPATGAFGYFIPSNTIITNGITCRQLLAFNSAKQIAANTIRYQYRFCNLNDEWKIVSWRIQARK